MSLRKMNMSMEIPTHKTHSRHTSYSLRKHQDNYTTRRVNQIKEKYQKNTLCRTQTNKENTFKTNTKKYKKQVISKRIQQLEGMNSKLHQMIIELKKDYEEMEECPSRHPQPNQPKMPTHKKLIKRLIKQIKYDKEFIETKYRMHKQCKKEKIISVLLKVHRMLPEIEAQHVSRIIEIDEEEMDPFYTDRNYQSVDDRTLTQQLIQNYVKSMRHWNGKLYKQFRIQQLHLEDLFQREKVTKGDFARFMSVHGKVLQCNRDICLLFKRIKRYMGGEELSREQLIDSLCR